MDKDKDDDALEYLMGKLGDFGRYQRFQFLLHILAGGTAGLHVLTLATVAFTPEHRCALPELDVNGTVAPWDTPEVVAAIPAMHTGGLHSCHIYNATNHTVPCDEWVFDDTYRTSSRVIDWNLVCDRRWMVALAQCCYMLGVFTGGIVLGRLSDKIGRKKVFCVSATLQLILGVLDAFVPEFYTFLFVRYLYGIFGSSGAYIAAFVLTMELVGPSKRTVCGVSFQVAFAVGIMVVAGWATIIVDRVWLQVIYGLHALLLMPHWWIMDESPRWLWAQGRIGESIAIIQKALNMNGVKYTIDTAQYVSKVKARESRNEERSGLGELFRYPNLRKKTMNICLCWFANSLVYYGLALNTGKLYGHPNFNLFLSGLTELPSYLIILYSLDSLGHRALISSFMLAGGVLCIVVTFLGQGTTLSTTLVLFGKMFISGSFSIAYKYSAELFPTVVRNSALGLGSMFASLSGAMTPLITLLDSFDPRIPSNIFGVIALVSGALCLFLPETLGHPMLQTIADGEEFGVGDTCFTTCLGSHRNEKKKRQVEDDEAAQEAMMPSENFTKA